MIEFPSGRWVQGFHLEYRNERGIEIVLSSICVKPKHSNPLLFDSMAVATSLIGNVCKYLYCDIAWLTSFFGKMNHRWLCWNMGNGWIVEDINCAIFVIAGRTAAQLFGYGFCSKHSYERLCGAFAFIQIQTHGQNPQKRRGDGKPHLALISCTCTHPKA